jgi:photosynthetic reaction center cytochrome c subunit
MILRRCISLVLVAVFAAGICLLTLERDTAALVAGTSAQREPASVEKTAEQVYKNIQVLKDLPASELNGVMEFMSASLGVGCTHCHSNPWDSDSKSAKLGTRRMILMTRAINKENFSSNPAITCYTCHHGQPSTVPLPPIDLATAHWTTDNEAPTAKPAAIVSTDAIIERYIRAIGGEAAIEKIKTRVLRGTETTTNRMTQPLTGQIEIYQANGNKQLIVRGANGTTLQGFDGTRGWTKDARGVRETDAKELGGIRTEADFYRYLKIKENYPQMRVLAREKIGAREVYAVGATSRDDSREKLYFDTETGLLVRRYVSFKTAFGSIPEVTDFKDYRDVNGVKFPFIINWSRPPFSSNRNFTNITLNVTVDSARFEFPTR